MKVQSALTGLAIAGTLVVGAIGGAGAADPADFFKNKRITLYIGYSSGGGYDRYARTIARAWPDHIPGKPSMTAKNRPGAGSVRLTNELYNVLPKDGTAIGTVSRGVAREELWGTKGIRYKSAKFNWIGSANNEVSVCVTWHEAGIDTLQDFLTREIIVGGTGPAADTDTFPQVLNNVMGTKLKLVTGYPGGNDINLAMERGEVQGRCGWSWSSVVSTRSNWLKAGKIKVQLQMSVSRHPDLKDVPFIMDLAKTERDRKVLELIYASQAMGRPFLAPPGVPEDRVKTLRASFMATMKDPAFLKMATKAKLEITPVSGEEVQAIITSMFQAPADVIAAAKFAATNRDRTKIAKAKIPVVTVSGKITRVRRKGSRVSWQGDVKKGKLRVGGKTKVSIAGQKAKRGELKVGMQCDFTIKGVETALAIACE